MSHLPYQQETFSASDHRIVVKFTLVITYQYIKFLKAIASYSHWSQYYYWLISTEYLLSKIYDTSAVTKYLPALLFE